MLVRARPSGYGFHTKLTAVEEEIIDSQLPSALDAIGGGSYTATAPIIWNGFWTFAGASNDIIFETFVHLNNSVVVSGQLELDGLTFINDDVTVNGAAIGLLGGGLTGNGTAIFAWAGPFSVSHATSFTGLATFTGGAAFFTGGTVTLGVNTNSGAAFRVLTGGSFSFDAGSTAALGTYLAIGSADAGILCRYLNMPNADTTVASGVYDFVNITDQSATHFLKLMNGTTIGQRITVSMTQGASGSGANGVQVQTQGGVTLVTMKYKTTGSPWRTDWVWTGAAWGLLEEVQWP